MIRKGKKTQEQELEQNAIESEALVNDAPTSDEEGVKEEVQDEAGAALKSLQDENTKLLMQLAEYQDKYLRLAAEFDNYRKRTLREKSELIQTAGEQMLVQILPVMDDFDRSMDALEQVSDVSSLRDGVGLIHAKFQDFLSRQGVREMQVAGTSFDAELHEAVSLVQAPDEDSKGKVLAVLQKGYSLNDKIIRFAKVVVGQ